MKATLIGRVNHDAMGFQQLWKLDPPLTTNEKQIDHVVTSEIDSSFGCECLVFPSDSTGVVLDWGEIGGGEYLSDEEALEKIGYLI